MEEQNPEQENEQTIAIKTKEPLSIKLGGMGWKSKVVPYIFFGALIFGPTYLKSCRSSIAHLSGRKTVARIPIYGTIDSRVSNNTIAMIEKAKSENVDAIIFEINSPGGYVLPSKEISDIINEELDNKIPTIAWIRNSGASGAYWAGSAADTLIADEASMVGSIGVRLSYLELSGLMEKLGVKMIEITGGKHKSIGSPYKELTEEERKMLEDHVNKIHQLFISNVAKNRNMPYEEVEKLATGWIYTGDEAKKNGLIDEVGNRKAVQVLLEKKLGTKDFTILNYEVKPSFFDALLSGFSDIGKSMGEGFGEYFSETAEKKVEE